MAEVTHIFSIVIDKCERTENHKHVTITAKDLPPAPQHAIMFQVPADAAYQFYPGQELTIEIKGAHR